MHVSWINQCVLDNSELTVLSLNKVQLNRVIRDLLLVLRCRVEIYEEDISGKGLEVTAKGDLTHYDDFKDIVEGCVELSELSTLMAVRMCSDNMKGEEENKITAVFCNPHDMRITVAEFADTPNFSHLSECIQIMVPRQCLLFKADRDANMKAFIQLENALRRPNLPYSVIDYSSKDLDKIKEEFLSLLFKDWSGYSGTFHLPSLYYIHPFRSEFVCQCVEDCCSSFRAHAPTSRICRRFLGRSV